MKIKALAPWFGSKRGLAPTIIEQLGPHVCVMSIELQRDEGAT